MQIVNMLPIREAVLVAVAISSFLTVVLAVIFYRRTKNRVPGRTRRAKPVSSERIGAIGRRDEGQELVREIEAMVLKITSTLDRLEIALKRCTDLLDQVVEENDDSGQLHIIHSPEPGSKVIRDRVAKLVASGIDEKDIASTLSLTEEQLKLYMHNVKEERDVVQV